MRVFFFLVLLQKLTYLLFIIFVTTHIRRPRNGEMQHRNFFVFNRDLDVGTVLTVPYLKIRKIINFAFCGHQISDIELIKK